MFIQFSLIHCVSVYLIQCVKRVKARTKPNKCQLYSADWIGSAFIYQAYAFLYILISDTTHVQLVGDKNKNIFKTNIKYYTLYYQISFDHDNGKNNKHYSICQRKRFNDNTFIINSQISLLRLNTILLKYFQVFIIFKNIYFFLHQTRVV